MADFSPFWGFSSCGGLHSARTRENFAVRGVSDARSWQPIQPLIEANQEQQQDTVKVGNDGVNAAIAPDDVSIVADQAAKNNAMVAMSVEDMGRSDPFLPEGEKVVVKPKPKKPAYANYRLFFLH